MVDRLQYAKALYDRGLYRVRGLWASVVGLCGSLGILASLTADQVPVALRPYVTHLNTVGLWSLAVVFLSGLVLTQAPKVLPKTPLRGAPSLLDDERGQ